VARRDRRDLARALITRARGDETLVRKVLDDHEVSDSIVGFHAQQAVEKALKAVLAARGVSFQKTHALGYLLGLVDDSAIAGPPELARADELSPWAVEFRYELDDEPELDRRDALRVVTAIVDWAAVEVAEPPQ
jgi:HEPN domain-containing protein